MQTATAAYIAERAQRSINLLEGLYAALIVAKHPELARITEMINEDATAIKFAMQFRRESRQRTRKRAVLEDLKSLAGMAGMPSLPIVIRAGRTITKM